MKSSPGQETNNNWWWRWYVKEKQRIPRKRKTKEKKRKKKGRWKKTTFGHSLSLKAFFLLSGTEKSLERRVKVTPGESTAGPRGRLLIQSLVVGSSLHIWTPSTRSRQIIRKNKDFWLSFFLSRFSRSQLFIDAARLVVIIAMLRLDTECSGFLSSFLFSTRENGYRFQVLLTATRLS